jgi:hypothetical protein
MSSEDEDVLVIEIVKMMNELRDEMIRYSPGSGYGNSWTLEEIHDFLAELRARHVRMTPSVQAKVTHSLAWQGKPGVKSDTEIFFEVSESVDDLVDTVTSQADVVIDSAPSDETAKKHEISLVLAEIREVAGEIESELEKARLDESIFPKGQVEFVRIKKRLVVYQEQMANFVNPSDDGLREFHREILTLLDNLNSIEHELNEALEDERMSLKKHKEMERQRSWLVNDRRKLKNLLDEKREIVDLFVKETDELMNIQRMMESDVLTGVQLEKARREERELEEEIRQIQHENDVIQEQIRRKKDEEAAQEQRELEERNRREEEEGNRASSHESSYNLARKEFFDKAATRFREVIAGVRYSRENETAEVLARSLARQQLREAVENDDALNRYMHDFVDRSCIPRLVRTVDEASYEMRRETRSYLFALIEPVPENVRRQSPEPGEDGRSSSIPHWQTQEEEKKKAQAERGARDSSGHEIHRVPVHSSNAGSGSSQKSYDAEDFDYNHKKGGTSDSRSHDPDGSEFHDVPEPETSSDESDGEVMDTQDNLQRSVGQHRAPIAARLDLIFEKAINFLALSADLISAVLLYLGHGGVDSDTVDRLGAEGGDQMRLIKENYIVILKIYLGNVRKPKGALSYRIQLDRVKEYYTKVSTFLRKYEAILLHDTAVRSREHTRRLKILMEIQNLLKIPEELETVIADFYSYVSRILPESRLLGVRSSCLSMSLGSLGNGRSIPRYHFSDLRRNLTASAQALIKECRSVAPSRNDDMFFRTLLGELEERYRGLSNGVGGDGQSENVEIHHLKARIEMVERFYQETFRSDLPSNSVERHHGMQAVSQISLAPESYLQTRADQLRSTPLLYKAWLEASDPP